MSIETFNLNEDQAAALASIEAWLAKPYDGSAEASYFVVKGPAGTGKTYTLKALISRFKQATAFCAPTNKAVRVLRSALTSESFKPQCLTIFSLLGLQLEASGEVKEIRLSEDAPDLSKLRLVVLDEGSMASRVLCKYLFQAVETYKFKVLILGDNYQLPPVKEQTSKVWDLPKAGAGEASLTRIMRFDNQILALSKHLREEMEKVFPKPKLESNNDGEEGVWKQEKTSLLPFVSEQAAAGGFQNADPAKLTKIICWRNVTVEKANALVRQYLFAGEALSKQWVPTDRLIVAEPAKDLEGRIMASTDTEGTVTKVFVEPHPQQPDYKVYALYVTTDDGQLITLRVLHEDSMLDYKQHLDDLSAKARASGRYWKDFWAFKETFHTVKHGYAITAHRAQGSTYHTAIVDWYDILRNPDRAEAMRCLYVACTRPAKRLYLGTVV